MFINSFIYFNSNFLNKFEAQNVNLLSLIIKN